MTLAGAVYTDNFGADPRVRVDVGQTGFFGGRMFRSYVELNVAAGSAGANPVAFRFTCPVDFILWEQSLELDQGALRIEVFTGTIAPSGTWNALPVIGQNRMNSRKLPLYVPKATFETGGAFTGGTAVDLLRVRTGQVNNLATNVGQAVASERGLPAGTYYIRAAVLDGLPVNDASKGVFAIRWEERP